MIFLIIWIPWIFWFDEMLEKGKNIHHNFTELTVTSINISFC